MEISNPVYKVGQIVYFNIPEEQLPGIVIDLLYYSSLSEWKYVVRFVNLDIIYCTEIELSRKKRIV